jgi:hypothetical protein
LFFIDLISFSTVSFIKIIFWTPCLQGGWTRKGNSCQGHPFLTHGGCELCALTGIQIANKKALQAIMLEGLHPVFLTLFYVLPLGLCLSQSETISEPPFLPLRQKKNIFQRPQSNGKLARQVFWLSDLSTICAFPPGLNQTVASAEFVPDYSGGTTPDFNGIPF